MNFSITLTKEFYISILDNTEQWPWNYAEAYILHMKRRSNKQNIVSVWEAKSLSTCRKVKNFPLNQQSKRSPWKAIDYNQGEKRT